jgi:hypothetical protein
MHGPVMPAGPMMMTGALWITTDRRTLGAGVVSFVATNADAIALELLVLPLASDDAVGTRAAGSDGRVDEHPSVGEASRTCGSGTGDGIRAGSHSRRSRPRRPMSTPLH